MFLHFNPKFVDPYNSSYNQTNHLHLALLSFFIGVAISFEVLNIF